ncbi:MAG: HAMP domain-containing sensor histidine kinase [bacterium]|nr:HAMP domain-containing sensor histidine kinase [bacterium]
MPRFVSIAWRVVTLVGASATFTALVVWLGTRQGVSPAYTLPFAITASVLVAWAIMHTTLEPLRQATRAARDMARGDYSVRVSYLTQDEVGQLAQAFNRMAQDLAEVDRLHRELVANVSHELRTPVAALRSRLENLADGVEPATPENLEAAVVQSERLTDMLTYLLDLSRLESGTAGLETEPMLVADLLDDAMEVARLAAQRRGATVHFASRIEPADQVITGDPVRLAQVLVNLLDNATRHAPPDSVVTVDALKVRQNLRIDVTDTGPGVPEEDRERIFGRFQRSDSGAAVGGGSGIGLAIARWAVSLHGGEIAVVDSEVGARFRVTLPLAGPGETRGRRGSGGSQGHG